MKRQYGRAFIADDRDKKYKLKASSTNITSKNWTYNWVGDQGYESSCVGFGCSGYLYSSPIKQWLNPTGIYKLAQYVDEWEGEDYDGTSVRAGVKVLKMLGAIESYHWTWSVEDIANHILTTGPVIVGTNWYEGMDWPNEEGLITTSGKIRGGHCYLLYGYSKRKDLFRMKNSYGLEWGINGTARVSSEDMQRLLDEDGEACVGFEQKFSPKNA